MADTAIAITAGSGTNVDTRTEGTNGNHRQVVVLGDPATNAGVAAVDATNGLSVNVTNSSLTVGSHAVTNAGTFAVQAAQSGTWTVQPGNTANTTAWKVDASSVAVPVTDNSGSLTVDNGGTFAVQAAQSGNWNSRTQDGSGNAITSAARGSERAMTVQIVDGSGAQVTTFGGAGGTSSNVGSAVPSAATAAGFSDGTNLRIPRVYDGDSGAGTEYIAGVLLKTPASGGTADLAVGSGSTSASTLRTTLATDSAGIITTGTAGSASSQVVTVQGISSMTPLTVASHAVTNAGTFAVQAAGDVASGSSDSGSPVKAGGQARTTNPTAVTDGQRVNFIADKLGKQICVSAVRDLKGIQQAQLSNTTSETTIVTAVASTFLDLYGLILANTGSTATTVTIKDSTAGTTRAKVYVPAGDTRGFMLDPGAAIPQATVNNNWTATCSAATTAMEVTAMFVKNT
jgi:hypothetical protein